jgi:hypothetical protein
MPGTVDSWNALGSAIYSRLATPLGSALYDAVADGTAPLPYTVWQVLANSDDYAFGADDKEQESLDVMLRCVSDRYWPDKARTMYGTVHNYMQSAPLSVTGFNVLRCLRRGSKFQYQDSELFWNVGAIYAVRLQRA